MRLPLALLDFLLCPLVYLNSSFELYGSYGNSLKDAAAVSGVKLECEDVQPLSPSLSDKKDSELRRTFKCWEIVGLLENQLWD